MSDFTKLQYNVQNIPHTTRILEAFPILQTLKAWKLYSRRDPDKLFRYTILVYDKKSPFIREYSDLPSRKNKALTLAGFIRDSDGSWPDFVDEITTWSNQQANDVFLAYMKHQNEMKWAQRCSLEEQFWANFRILNKDRNFDFKGQKDTDIVSKAISDDATLRDKLKNANMQLLRDMEELDSQLFMDDQQAAEAFRKLAPTNPEHVAKLTVERESA